ncbi:golgin subfamily A member 3 [Pseudonaja textilis]|uniref:golgin subfamily A member 3 n=1 Tax=Pseudonaja textilis TaxID=8673 RepID=UPI000EA9B0AF|nr:golgin subfamily A member 3 [Pseudonaja textilis]
MDSSAVIQEASHGTLGSSERQPDLEVRSTTEGEDLNLFRVNNGRGSTEGDTSALKSSQDPCANGPMSYDPEEPLPLGPTESSRVKEPASGVPGFREHLKASRGDSDESLALRKDALQSLKLSLPLQETELCSADAPLPLEKEEVIRLQARKRLEEQLKQYRVKRHQERLFTAKSRPSSTLDPELMWNPEILPRASTVAMTKEYSFLRTSVPRGPKVGSLGLPASLKEKKSSKSSRTSRIRSLADYRTENPDGSAGGTMPMSNCSGGSLKPNSNSLTSVVSSISLSPDSDDRLEASSLAGDSLSEMDGSEAGMRLDGNESDSSTYSSVSGRGLASFSPQSKPGMAFTINGQEVPLDAVGQFPSIKEVLQAAATEQRAQDQEVNGEARSRRDSISSRKGLEVTTTKAESAHNRRHYKAAALELGEVKRELQAKEVLIQALQVEVDKLQGEDGKRSEEVSQIQRELVDARSQLQLLQKQLDDQLDKQPVENQELEDLKWEVEQKEGELQTLKQQLDLTEQRSQKELEGVQLVLQNLKAELEMVRDDLSITQKDKFVLQAKMSELKNSIKTLLQQNQQLKLDLKQGKMKKKKLKGETGSNPVTPVKIPDCPVPAALLEELLKPPSAVSKEPLRNLNSCLQQLRQEMDSLQRQMEEHTVTVHESMSSWTQIEGQLTDLTSNLSVTLLANESLPHTDLQDHKPNTDVQEEVTQ